MPFARSSRSQMFYKNLFQKISQTSKEHIIIKALLYKTEGVELQLYQNLELRTGALL